MSLCREVGVLGDLRELADEEVLELDHVEFTVEANLLAQNALDLFSGVTVAEAQNLLHILIAAPRTKSRSICSIRLGLDRTTLSLDRVHEPLL